MKLLLEIVTVLLKYQLLLITDVKYKYVVSFCRSKSGKLKTQFSNDTVALNTNLDLDMAGPIVDVAAVLKYQGWLAGANTQFDTQKAKFSKNNFAFGYQTNDFALHTNV